MAVTVYTFQQFKQLMATRFSSQALLPANTDPGSSLGSVFDAEGLMGLSIQSEIQYVATLARLASIPSNTDGTPNPDIDSFTAPFNIPREGPTAAGGAMTFTTPSPVSGGPLIVPVGGQVTSQSGLIFQVQADASNPDYNAGDNGYPIANGDSTTAPTMLCLTTGTLGNVSANTVFQPYNGVGVPTIAGIQSVTNGLAYTNGLNSEPDAAYKVRFTLQISTGVVATANALLAAASAVEANLTYSLGDRVNPDGSAHAAYFSVFINLLGQNAGPGSPLISAVTSALELIKAVGISFVVNGPTLVPVNALGTIIPTANAPSTLVADVNAAYTAYANNIGLAIDTSSTRMPFSKAYSIVQAVTGVDYIDGMTLNSGTSDIVATFGNQIVAGTAGFHT